MLNSVVSGRHTAKSTHIAKVVCLRGFVEFLDDVAWVRLAQ